MRGWIGPEASLIEPAEVGVRAYRGRQGDDGPWDAARVAEPTPEYKLSDATPSVAGQNDALVPL